MRLTAKTRSASWEATQDELAPRTKEVFNLLKANPEGLTAWEIAEVTGRYVHAVRPRLTELAGEGRIMAVGTRWHANTERHEAVWRVVQQESDGQMAFA